MNMFESVGHAHHFSDIYVFSLDSAHVNKVDAHGF